MSLGPGTRLGPYEIQSAIGVGGMGEVYKARDTRLKRDVALKVLPDLYATDSDRLARFQREAGSSLREGRNGRVPGARHPVSGSRAQDGCVHQQRTRTARVVLLLSVSFSPR